MEKGHRFALWGRGEGSGASQGHWCNCIHSRNLEEEGKGGAAVRPVHVPGSGMGGGGPNNTVNSNEETTDPALLGIAPFQLNRNRYLFLI